MKNIVTIQYVSRANAVRTMTPQIPDYALMLEPALRSFVAAIGLGLIWIGAARMEAPARTRYGTAAALSAVFIAWFAAAQYLAAENVYQATSDGSLPTVLLGLLIPLIAAAVSLWLSPSIASLVSAIPLPWIVAAQIYRVGGGIFLMLWADGRMPWQFALPAGIGDVVTGAAAVVVAILLAQNAAGARRAAYAWCLFGIADLVVAVTMGGLTSPGFLHLLARDTPNVLVTSYPLAMVPTFAVPLALMLHGGSGSRVALRQANSPWHDIRSINNTSESGQSTAFRSCH
jgi:hypothetical protein